MRLIEAWRNKKSALIGFIVIIFVLLWPSIPLRGVDVWIKTLFDLFPTNILYPIMAILVASYAVLYVHNRQSKTCNTSATSGASASFAGVLLGACPACIPVLAFFLPLSITVTLSYYSWIFLTVSIAILFFAIYKMEGFK